ncbi:DUF3413 domain-containing protein [Thalassotalea sp. PS06]|uniref:DUF3413 domain-containing protein n=1 Tax=Thalassotalea sp. PS06 TaxID=2594005 RepID=UPI00116342F7|nr:DUF3413 domain-containing protein [Thalassotalea sp. PS06]QDP01327.1 DUF3413 domain-containing protein [Thalassotalea sp. PS06]
MVSTENTTYSKRLLQLISWGHWFTFFNILAAIAISIIYLIVEGKPDGFIATIYMLTTWISHMAFLTFLGFVLLVFPLTLLFPRIRFIRGAASIIFTLVLTLLVIDSISYSQLGYHLNLDSSGKILSLLKDQFRDYQVPFYWLVGVSLLAILAFELVISNYSWKHLKQLQQKGIGRYFALIWVTSFFISHLTHIWADAKLEYSVLRQDNMLPLSYPTTAKTLLTKYGLVNQEGYIDKLNQPMAFSVETPDYPSVSNQCAVTDVPEQSVFILLNDSPLTSKQTKRLLRRSDNGGQLITNLVDASTANEAWFNLMYSLPSVYKDGIVSQQQAPVLMQLLEQQSLSRSLAIIGDEVQTLPVWLSDLFSQTRYFADISPFVTAQKLNNLPVGLYVFYFAEPGDYQFSLFSDALLLAQEQKQTQDIIFVSSLGNKNKESRFMSKPGVVIWPERSDDAVMELASHMDMQATLMKRWLNCDMDRKSYSSGRDIFDLPSDRVLANTLQDGIVIFQKDKTVFVDDKGNFESFSSQLDTPLSQSDDFPRLIEGVKFINQFSVHNRKPETEQE